LNLAVNRRDKFSLKREFLKVYLLYLFESSEMKIILKTVVGVTVGLIVGTLWYVSPIMKPFPKPTGPYSIGTESFYFVDHNRNDTFSSGAEKRSVVVRIWYPSAVQMGEKYPYLGTKMPIFQKGVADFYNIPYWISTLLWRNITTHAYSNAPLAATLNTYPVILFSHGLLGFPSDTYVTIIENLASHGYIVVGIDHPYFNVLTHYPDGRVVTSNDLSAQFQKMRPQEQNEFLSKAIDTYKADMKFVIDQLEKLNNNDQTIFYKRLDLARIGVMGHSAGGTASIEFCRTDNRCKAAADLDGWYDHVIGNEQLKKPLLLMFGSKSIEVSEPTPEYLKRKEITREQYYEREQKIANHKQELCKEPHCSMIIIPDAEHGDFGDDILLKWPLNSWTAIDPYKTLTIINDHIVKFFDTYFKEAQ